MLRHIDNYFELNEYEYDTKRIYKPQIKRFLEWLVESDYPENALFEYKRYLTLKNYKMHSVNFYLAISKKYLIYLKTNYSHEYPELNNLITTVRPYHLKQSKNKDILSKEEIKSVREAIRNSTNEKIIKKRDEAMYLLMVLCGLRAVEVTRIQIADLKQRNGVYIIEIQGKKQLDKNDYVKVPNLVYNAIRSYQRYRDLQYNGNDINKYMFISHSNRSQKSETKLTTRTIANNFDDYFRLSGVKALKGKISLHSLRHTAISQALASGMDILEVKELARHSNIATTNTYLQLTKDLSNETEDKLQNFIFD